MMETTVVHFSGMQVMLMIALCAIAVLVPVWAIRRIARAVPPVYQVPGIPSGVGGLLLFTIVLLIVEAVNALYHFGRAAGEAARVISMSTDYLWPVAQTLIPDFAASFFLLIAIGALVFGRSSVALGAAVVCAWLGGPLVAVLRTIYLGLPIGLAGEPTGLLVLTVVVTLYLLFSNRPALTYGTASGRRLALSRGGSAVGER